MRRITEGEKRGSLCSGGRIRLRWTRGVTYVLDSNGCWETFVIEAPRYPDLYARIRRDPRGFLPAGGA